jgi:hypothetical protein
MRPALVSEAEMRRVSITKGERPTVKRQTKYDWDYLYGALEVVEGSAFFEGKTLNEVLTKVKIGGIGSMIARRGESTPVQVGSLAAMNRQTPEALEARGAGRLEKSCRIAARLVKCPDSAISKAAARASTLLPAADCSFCVFSYLRCTLLQQQHSL